MFFNNNLENPDAFLDEGIMFKVSPNPGLNLADLRATGPRSKKRDASLSVKIVFSNLHNTETNLNLK